MYVCIYNIVQYDVLKRLITACFVIPLHCL